MEANTTIYNIYFDKEIDSVVMDWDGYATSEQFKEGTELMLDTLIKNKANKVLADIKDMVLIGREDQIWLDENFLPRAIKAGFKAITTIDPFEYNLKWNSLTEAGGAVVGKDVTIEMRLEFAQAK